MELNENLITFGKYKDQTLQHMLKDRSYCKWLLEQEWFGNYEYIYNKVLTYNPIEYFIQKYEGESCDFLDCYEYFNLTPSENLKIKLCDIEKECYEFYLKTVKNLRDKIILNKSENKYDIKAPQKWLQTFEKETSIDREEFKIFMSSYDLKNITSIVEDIKSQGGIEYKGAKSFLIAKKNSEIQEGFWGDILKRVFEGQISTQFKYENCIFDFINISKNTIYECKLSFKDFNDDQYNKYLKTLNKFKIVYLIDNDCIVDITSKSIFTISREKYKQYQKKKHLKPNFLDKMIIDFEIIEIDELIDFV